METALAVFALALLIGIPFWFALRPFKNPKQRLSDDNLTEDRVDRNSQNLP
jgi:hypothetical protein